MSNVQFSIARRAADALPIESVLPGARAAGEPNAHPEHNAHHAGVGKVRITCSIEMAAFVVERLTELAVSLEGKNQTQLIIGRTYGVKAALDAMEHEVYGPAGKPAASIRTSSTGKPGHGAVTRGRGLHKTARHRLHSHTCPKAAEI